MTTKQVIVVRTDLRNKRGEKVRTGKLMAQVGHASSMWLVERVKNSGWETPGKTDLFFTQAERLWMSGDYAKIVLKCKDEVELMDLAVKAKNAGVKSYYVRDLGLTEFDFPTITALAIGPDEACKVDVITKHLEIY